MSLTTAKTAVSSYLFLVIEIIDTIASTTNMAQVSNSDTLSLFVTLNKEI